MARDYIEARIVRAGMRLRQRRAELGGKPMAAEDLGELTVRTFSPSLQALYIGVGSVLTVAAFWIQFTLANMAVAIPVLMTAVVNIMFALHGRPRQVSALEPEVNLAELKSEIDRRFAELRQRSS